MSNQTYPYARGESRVRFYSETNIADDVMSVVRDLMEHTVITLVGASITMQDIQNIEAILKVNGYESECHLCKVKQVPAVFIAARKKINTPGTKHVAGAEEESRRAFVDYVIWTMDQANATIELDYLGGMLRADPDFNKQFIDYLTDAITCDAIPRHVAYLASGKVVERLSDEEVTLEPHRLIPPAPLDQETIQRLSNLIDKIHYYNRTPNKRIRLDVDEMDPLGALEELIEKHQPAYAMEPEGIDPTLWRLLGAMQIVGVRKLIGSVRKE